MEQLDWLDVSEHSHRKGCGDNFVQPAHVSGRSPRLAPDGARARVREPDAWSLEPHICRHCGGGRLVSQAVEGGRRYLCTNCGAEAVGGPASLCFCGLRVRRHGPAGGLIDPGVRCHHNPNPTPEFPSLIVASERPPARESDS